MSEAETEEEEAKKGGGKKKLIIMVVVLLAIGFVVAKKTVLKPPPLTPTQIEAKAATETYELESKCAAANELPPPPAPKVEGAKKTAPTTVDQDEPVIGPVIEVDSKTLNLADGHFLKYSVAVQLPADAAKDEIEDTENWGVITSQAMLNTFANESMADILPTKQREALRHQVSFEVCTESEGSATTVYFTEFVAQ